MIKRLARWAVRKLWPLCGYPGFFTEPSTVTDETLYEFNLFLKTWDDCFWDQMDPDDRMSHFLPLAEDTWEPA